MSDQEYTKFMESFSSDLINTIKIPIHNLYGPLSKKYWQQKYKIAMYNLEPYDPIQHIRTVDISTFKGWFRAPTIHYAALIIHTIFTNIEGGRFLSENEIRENYRHKDELLAMSERMAYLNIRVTDNNSVAADYDSIAKELNKTEPYLKKQLKLLKPNVVIIGSSAGCYYFNQMYKMNLTYRSSIKYDNLLMVSLNHMSGRGARGGWYKMIHANTKLIAEYLIK